MRKLRQQEASMFHANLDSKFHFTLNQDKSSTGTAEIDIECRCPVAENQAPSRQKMDTRSVGT